MGVLLAAVLLLGASPAVAAPSAADRETARGLLDEGDRDVARRDFAGALRAYQGADAIMHVPTTAIEVARTQAELGLLIEARETALGILRMPQQANEPAAFVQARQTGAQLAEALAARIPSVVVAVLGLPATATRHVSVDGDPIPTEAAALPRKVNPGKHTVVVGAPGYTTVTREVTVAERARAAVEVLLEPGTESAPPPPGVAAPGPRRSRALAYALWGVGGAGIATGTVTGILSITTTSEANRFCNAYGVCRPAAQPDINSAMRLAWASDVAFGVGLVGAALGTVFYFTRSGEQPPPPTAGLRLTAGPARGGGMVGLKARF
jgi:hypothetical protein